MDKKSPLLRILLHGFFMVSVNLFSVMVAFAIAVIFSLGNGEIVHATLALVLNLVVYLTVYSLMRSVESGIMRIDSWSMLMAILMISLAMLPAVYYPIYYFTHGGWSSFDNLITTWPFQIIVNSICLVLNFFIVGKKPAK